MTNHAKNFALAVLGTATLGCKNNDAQETKKPVHAPTEQLAPKKKLAHEGLDKLQKFTFVEQDGKPVNLDTISKWIGNRNSIISFQYAGCSDGVCQRITDELFTVAQQQPNTRTIVISTRPHDDFSGGGALMSRLKAQGLKPENTKVLYPVGEGADLFKRLASGKPVGARAQQAFGLLTIGLESGSHSSEIFLFDATGKQNPDIFDVNAHQLADKILNATSNSNTLER